MFEKSRPVRKFLIFPEIEMPAHAMSVIAAYPELSCHKRPIGVPSGAVWPITDIYCAGQEETFDFIEEVLTEVLALLPSWVRISLAQVLSVSAVSMAAAGWCSSCW